MPTSIRKEFSLNRAFEFDSGVHFVRPMLMAILVGVGTGFMVVGFVKLVNMATNFFFSPAVSGTLWVIAIPVIGGLIVGPLLTTFSPEAKGHGVPEILKAIALRGGKIRPVVILGKVFGSIISIGTGFSIGREGPIAQSGAAFGSLIGQVLRLNESRVKNLVACGAAAGIAGVFNTPIAGVMFASEVILRDFGANALSTVVVASVSSSIIARIFLGDHPSFIVPTYNLHHPLEIVLYFILGILSALAAVLFVVFLEGSEDIFEKWKVPEWIKPAFGGLIIGCVGFYFPQVFGSGLPAIEDALHGNFTLNVLLALIFVKIVATAVSLGSGSSGGVFAPLLFVGAVLGGALGQIAGMHYIVPIAPSGAYALVGMASVFAAAARAPITSILIVFEMTGSYGMILPIMIGVIVSTSISQFMLKDSVYLSRLRHKGIDIGAFEEARLLEGLRVSDAMTQDFQVISQGIPAKDLIQLMSQDMTKTIFVINQKGRLVGMIKPHEINKALLAENSEAINAHDIAVPLNDYSFPDEPLNEAVKLMHTHHLTELPVVDTLDATQILGILKSEDVFRVYTEHISNRGNVMNKLENDQIAPVDISTIVFTVTSRSPIAGKPVKELNLPEGVHFNVVKKGTRFFVPHGNMTIAIRDKITATVMPQHEASFRKWLKENKLKDF